MGSSMEVDSEALDTGRTLDEVPWDVVVRLYRSGYTGPVLARLVGCAPKTIYRKLRQAGIEVRPQGSRPST